MVKVVLIRKALNVNSTACSLDSSEALGNNTIVIELEKKLTIRDRLTATTYSPKSAGLNKPSNYDLIDIGREIAKQVIAVGTKPVSKQSF